MKFLTLSAGLALGLILASAPAAAQFQTLAFVDIPAIGSWAEYQVATTYGESRKIVSRRISLVASNDIDGRELLWFQIQTEADGLAGTRQPLVYQAAVYRDDAATGRDIFANIQELIVQVGSQPAFRISRDFLDVGMRKNLLAGGGGAGTDIEYEYRERPDETIESGAGAFTCKHTKGIGKGEVVIDLKDPRRHGVESLLDLWYDPAVPFGVVRRVVATTGEQAVTAGAQNVTLAGDETTELIAFGTGAVSAVTGRIIDYTPEIAQKLRPQN